jgi:hypothetical protein
VPARELDASSPSIADCGKSTIEGRDLRVSVTPSKGSVGVSKWILGIDVDKYPTDQACARGAVRDALGTRQGLSDSGSVSEGSITLMLGRGETAVPAAVAPAVPMTDQVINAAVALIALSDGGGYHFFFDHAGHQLSTQRDFAFI